MTQSAHMQIANTVLAQLGGNRFRAMTGARDFVGLSPTADFLGGLQFGLPARLACNGVNKVQIFLTASDTYTVKALKVKPKTWEVEVKGEAEHVYFDTLQATFRDLTGLDTHL